MKHQIKNRFTGDVIYECDVPVNLPSGVHTRHALESAVQSGAYLTDADLRGAYLTDADLRGAYLNGADLRGAYLNGAYLNGAYLNGADLNGAYLNGADLNGAKVGKETVLGNRPVFQIGPIGSRLDYLVAIGTDAGIVIRAGCFTGSVGEFLKKLESEHGDNIHAKEYRAALALIETHFSLWGAEETKGGA